MTVSNITFVTSQTASPTSTTFNVDTSGLALGDLAVVWFGKQSINTAITPPSGWTISIDNGNKSFTLIYKIMDVSGDLTATNTFTYTSSRGAVLMAAFRGCSKNVSGTFHPAMQGGTHVTQTDFPTISGQAASSVVVTATDGIDTSGSGFGVTVDGPAGYTAGPAIAGWGIGVGTHACRMDYAFVLSGTINPPNANINDTTADYGYNAMTVGFAPNTFPTSTVTAPSGTISNTNQPTVAWTFADVDGDTQAQYRVKIFTVADTLQGAFTPDTWPAVWDSGAVAGAAASVVVGTALAANVPFKAYVLVADRFGFNNTWDIGPTFTVTASGLDKSGRAFFVPTNGVNTVGPSFFEFADSVRNGSFTWQSAPLRDPQGRQVEIREVQVYARSYDSNASVTITVNGTARTVSIPVPGRQQLDYLFSERGKTLDVTLVSTAGTPASNEAPTIEVVRIGWRSLHQLR